MLLMQTYDTDHAVSPLSLTGGIDCCIELFSFAKSYHIAGFRLVRGVSVKAGERGVGLGW